MKSQLESIVKDYNKYKKPNVVAKLLVIEKNIITVKFSGIKPDAFLEDFKTNVEEKTNSKLFIENIKRDNGNRIVEFSIQNERGPADEILDALSKYYEGAPPHKPEAED